MIIYNVTVSVDKEIADDWLNWMRTVHIPDVMATGMFSDFRILKVVTGENSGVTYAIQYTCESHEVLENYQTRFAPALQKEHTERYGDKAAAFRTVLEII
jgi:hypothetical protein